MCPVKYPRELGKPTSPRAAAELAAAEPASRIDYLISVLFLLLDHYKIPHDYKIPQDPDQFFNLAIALALDHVPALRFSAKGRPRKPKLVKASGVKFERRGRTPAWEKELKRKHLGLPSDFYRLDRGDKMDLVRLVELIKAKEGARSDRQALERQLEWMEQEWGVSKLRMSRSLKTFQNNLSEGRRLLKNASQ